MNCVFAFRLFGVINLEICFSTIVRSFCTYKSVEFPQVVWPGQMTKFERALCIDWLKWPPPHLHDPLMNSFNDRNGVEREQVRFHIPKEI